MNDNKMDTSVYVDTSALQSWSSSMGKLNSSAIDILASFKETVNSLDDSWKGKSATGFFNSTERLMKQAVNCHNEMSSVEQFLIKVINTTDKM